MDAKLIERLASRDPENSESGMAGRLKVFQQINLNPAFGWQISGSFARARATFPETVIGRDHWLFQAYLMQLNPSGRYDPSVLEALRLSQKNTSAALKAFLIAGLAEPVASHLDIVAEKSGISRGTVEAFEILFFNVLDRHQDGLYISNIVYPEGRLVEFDEAYYKTTPIPDLILRAAYNHRDIDFVVRLAGMEDESCVNELVARRDSEAKLETRIMGNALLMAQSGLLNQRSVGLQRATTLLAASRSPRNKTQAKTTVNPEAHDLATELAAALASVPPITDADHQEARAASRPGRAYWSDDTGKVVALDDPPESQTMAGSSDLPEHTEMFPEARPAIWRNEDTDMPVVIVGLMKSPGFSDHYLATSGTGLPVSEVSFEV